MHPAEAVDAFDVCDGTIGVDSIVVREGSLFAFCHSPTKRRYTSAMTVSDEDVTEPHPAGPSTLRVRRYRERRR